MQTYKRLLLANKAWAKEKVDLRSDYFQKLVPAQTPGFLWIGCSDSRVPAEEITGVGPGEFFVHRNIANLFSTTDLNTMSVVQYAVEVLKVKHIIICGHYGCGGIKAAMSDQNLGLINQWLSNVRNIYLDHKEEISSFKSEVESCNKLVELNVLDQAKRISETSIIQKAWQESGFPFVHGWVYDINNGLIKDLMLIQPSPVLQKISNG